MLNTVKKYKGLLIGLLTKIKYRHIKVIGEILERSIHAFRIHTITEHVPAKDRLG